MKNDSPILTIAIPTYNRAAKLAAQLERLLPQLTPEVRLCVYDNASPDETQAVVAKFLPAVSYFRAATNCGGGRNIFRCFEECDTKWLWVLSDDDSVSATAVSDLLAVLKNQDCDFIHFSSFAYKSKFDKDVVVSDVELFLSHTTFPALLWISAGVYHVPSFRPMFCLYNQSISTWAPHLIMVLSLLESRGGRVLLSKQELLVCPQEPLTVSSWSAVDCILRISQAPEYLSRTDNQKLLASLILLEWYNTQILFGLRETAQIENIKKWQRICGQSHANLKAYHARGSMDHIVRNWFRSGCRWHCLFLLRQLMQIRLLNWCPAGWFHALAKRLPLAKDVRDNYNKRMGYEHYE